MAKYFNYFPKTFYNTDQKKNSVDVVTNIIARFSFNSQLKQNSSAFYQYDIKDGDTPEIIAHKYYGNAERHWIVLLFNDIVDAQFDWPMQYDVFNNYVDEKYRPRIANTAFSSGLSWARSQTNIHSYYVTNKKVYSINTEFEEKIEVDEDTYDQTVEKVLTYTQDLDNISVDILDSSTGITTKLRVDEPTLFNLDICQTEVITKSTMTYYEYEQDLNESKRKINLLKPEFVPEVEKEFKRVVKL
jgi:hypothetical protein